MRRRCQSGFTVIEILVALTLLAAVLLLLTRAFLTLLSVTTEGGNLTVATALASRRVEEIRTSVEAQQDRTAWRQAFCNMAAEPVTSFPPPYGAYSYRVLLNDAAVSPAAGQEDQLLPCWGIDWTAAPRCAGYGPPYATAAACAATTAANDEERLRWVTVEVYFRGSPQPAVRMTSAVIRGAYHR